MDGQEGDLHPYLGADIMGVIFGWEWFNFCLSHSRFLAKKRCQPYSRLCVADKLSVAMEPAWLYLPRARASGELYEYMSLAGGKDDSKYKGEPNDKYVHMKILEGTPEAWFDAVCHYLKQWVHEHKDLKEDTWTKLNGDGMS